jgi:NAD(P)-dependent dehydrogenase (short-subunit alcohol dehydrogenase family)
MNQPAEGGCLCGAVRYRVRGSAIASGICHCRSCRKTASAPTLPFATFPTAAFEITHGAYPLIPQDEGRRSWLVPLLEGVYTEWFGAQGGDPASWEQNFRLDVLGAVNAFEAARPFLEASGEKNGDAAIVIISSVSAAQADTASSYGPIKAALVHMAKGLARQYASKKIRVNVVSPGTVYFKGGVWNMVEQNMPKRYQDTLARNPLGRMATPQEIANAAVFLASPASSFTTGSNLIVDGAISNRVNF